MSINIIDVRNHLN